MNGMTWFYLIVGGLFIAGLGLAVCEWRWKTTVVRHDFSDGPNKIIGPDATRAKLMANGGGAGFNGMDGPS